jgi:hypothetical protein
MILKFDPSNKPAFIHQDYLLDDKETGQQVIGYYFIDPSKGYIRIAAGDFILINEDKVKLISKSEYYADPLLQVDVDKAFTRQLADKYYALAKQQPFDPDRSLAQDALLAGLEKWANRGSVSMLRYLIYNTAADPALFPAELKTSFLSEIDQYLS